MSDVSRPEFDADPPPPAGSTASAYRDQANGKRSFLEQSVHFILRFPGGFTATCSSGYASHQSRSFRAEGPQGWAEMNPAARPGRAVKIAKPAEPTRGPKPDEKTFQA